MGEQIIYNGEVIYDSTKKQTKNKYFKTLSKLFKNPVSFITVFTTIALVLAGINGIAKYSYYGIGWSLFSYDPRWVFPKILEFLIVWFILIGIPFINFKSFTDDDRITKLAKLFIYFVICCGLLYQYGDLITHYFKIATSDFIPNWICLLIFAVGLYADFYTIPKFNYERLTKNYKKFDFNFSKKLDVINFALFFLKIICTIFICIIFIIITSLNLIGVEQATNTKTYVTTVIDNNEKIILFESNDKLFLADFTVDKNGNCIIYTKKYSIEGAIGHDYQNLKVKKVKVEKYEEKPKPKKLKLKSQVNEAF